MIAALLTGRGGSRSIKDKNIYPILGRPLMEYPILAAKNSKLIEAIYLSTDSEKLAEVARKNNVKVIIRPKELGQDHKHAEAMVHGFMTIQEREKKKVEILVILMCNCATIRPGIIDEGIKILQDNDYLDSAVTVSKYNEFNPMRARKIENELLKPFIKTSYFADMAKKSETFGHDRNSLGDVYFCDGGAWIVKSRCLENISEGEYPYKWIGHKIYPLIQEGGFDVDNERLINNTIYWLKKHKFTENSTPYDR